MGISLTCNNFSSNCIHKYFNVLLSRKKPIKGFLNDYAFLIRGLLDLYECTLQTKWLLWADKLQEQQDKLFWDTEKFGYYSSSDEDSNIIMRFKNGKKMLFSQILLDFY